MAGSMKDIKLRIKSVESTMQITKAMELVASSKMRRAKERVEHSRPYFETLHETLTKIAAADPCARNPYLRRDEVKRTLLIVIAGDRGLAGGYNSNVLKQAGAEEGEVLVLGEVGLNFAAGMSGGIAYVYDETKTLKGRCNLELVELIEPNAEEIARIRELLEAHVEATASPLGVMMLYQFDDIAEHFTKAIPIEYAKMLDLITEYEAQGHTHEEAQELAFEITKMGA